MTASLRRSVAAWASSTLLPTDKGRPESAVTIDQLHQHARRQKAVAAFRAQVGGAALEEPMQSTAPMFASREDSMTILETTHGFDGLM